jgi:hypothetical protein
MKIYAQHGHGKSDKIDRALDARVLDGVVLGPNNERPESLRESVTRFREHASAPDVLLDPQLYVSLLNNPREGNLPLYDDYYTSNLTLRDFSPRRIDEFARRTLDFQLGLGVTRLVSPTIVLESFTDRSTQIAHFLAQSAMEYHAGLHDAPPLLLSYIFSESALGTRADVAEFLDTVSLFNAAGFYLVVGRPSSQYQQSYEPNRMAEWLMTIYSLSSRNRFEVICGYSDFVALPAAAVGATAAATGWFNSLRQFNVARFLPASGGRRPKERYSSAPLLNSIYLQELDNCYQVGRLRQVMTGTPFDEVLRGAGRPIEQTWPDDVSTLHHWATLREVFGRITGTRVNDRLVSTEQAIVAAQLLYADLRRQGVQFDPATGGAHLPNWLDAIASFRTAARL